ncbi:MAG: DUF4019 domain-containing protein [Candidatus Competibacteraceae bacterium]
MKNIKNILAAGIISLSFCALSTPAAENNPVNKAQDAAKAWLALTDAGKYGQSWDEAASAFKATVTKADWEKAAKSVRSPLGTVKSRQLKSATFTRTLPGAPDGEYVVIQYDTQFENKAATIETVTPMHEKDGSWRVSGYYIR